MKDTMVSVAEMLPHRIDEPLSQHVVLQHLVEKWHVREATEFHSVEVIATREHGLALFVDGRMLGCSIDERYYNEPLVHVPALIHGTPRRVLLLGVGTGAAAREALLWDCVENVTIVERDERLLRIVRENVGALHEGAFDDPRLETRVTDPWEFLGASAPRWDLVLFDRTCGWKEEPIRGGELPRIARRILAPRGVVAAECGGVWRPPNEPLVERVFAVRHAFPECRVFVSPVAAAYSLWGFVVASREPIDPRLDANRGDALLERHVGRALACVDGLMLRSLFSLPRFLREDLETAGARGGGQA